jgi:hypothetical protein
MALAAALLTVKLGEAVMPSAYGEFRSYSPFQKGTEGSNSTPVRSTIFSSLACSSEFYLTYLIRTHKCIGEASRELR